MFTVSNNLNTALGGLRGALRVTLEPRIIHNQFKSSDLDINYFIGHGNINSKYKTMKKFPKVLNEVSKRLLSC